MSPLHPKGIVDKDLKLFLSKTLPLLLDSTQVLQDSYVRTPSVLADIYPAVSNCQKYLFYALGMMRSPQQYAICLMKPKYKESQRTKKKKRPSNIE